METEPTNVEIAGGFEWCVAGGWAACPQLVQDQDVWIMVESDTMMGIRANILSANPSIVPEGDGDFEPETYGDLGIFVVKVGRIGDRHILLTTAKDIQSILDSFDISTHQCALSSNLEFVRGKNWTPLTVEPVKLRETPTTEDRFIKIRDRYAPFRTDGTQPATEDGKENL